MAAWWVRIDLLQNYFAIRNVCLWRWQIILTGFSAESLSSSVPSEGHQARCACGSEARPIAARRLSYPNRSYRQRQSEDDHATFVSAYYKSAFRDVNIAKGCRQIDKKHWIFVPE